MYDAALAPVGVNVAQWALLRKLSAAPDAGLSIGELAERTELERSTVSRNVRVLARLGLVELTGSTADRRAAAISLTAPGRAVLERGAPLWQQAQEQVETLLGADAAGQLRSLLRSV